VIVAPSVLAAWSSFYIMTGSSAAALTGLMFVVITLVSGEERRPRNTDGIATFSTPTVMHFSAVLLISAALVAPWPAFIGPAVVIGLAGFAGLVYLTRVVFRSRRITTYTPDLEDQVWYTGMPFVAYGVILGGAVALPEIPAGALFVLAGGVVLLIFIGIRNAWDIVTYLVIGGGNGP